MTKRKKKKVNDVLIFLINSSPNLVFNFFVRRIGILRTGALNISTLSAISTFDGA